ncbi:MAG: acyl-CoA dehydratase activase [Candidatus Heimdallarchaeota archaeon]
MGDSVFAGIDVGSATTKAVIINQSKKIIGHFIRKSGTSLEEAAEQSFQEALQAAALSRTQVGYIVATGYGRKNVPFADQTVTEISCTARGSRHYFPVASTIIDIGGQDTKIIKIDAMGKLIDFRMNRKCAAGTGTFLEEIAYKLDVPLNQLDHLAQKSTRNATLTSFCTVFASTEILQRIRAGEKVEDLIRGAFQSVANRVFEMDTLTEHVVMVGGVIAYNPTIIELLNAKLNTRILIPPNPQFVAAFGASLFALEAPN